MYRRKDRWIKRQMDKQTNERTGTHTEGQIDEHIHRQMERQMEITYLNTQTEVCMERQTVNWTDGEREVDTKAEVWIGGWLNRQKYRCMEKQMNIQTNVCMKGQTDRWRDRQTEIHMDGEKDGHTCKRIYGKTDRGTKRWRDR